VDPVAGMLNYGRAAARRAGVTNIDWRRGDSSRLAALDLGTPDAAVFAASFHWTDRVAVLTDLDRLLATDGAVVVINDVLDEHPDWVHAITELRERYLGPRQAFSAVSHRAVLESSPFSVVEAETLTWSRELSVEQVVGLQFSYSFSNPALFGDRSESFARDVRDAVRALYPTGEVTEDIAVEVLISRRSR
jgi:SAM-dependent methyltransferase